MVVVAQYYLLWLLPPATVTLLLLIVVLLPLIVDLVVVVGGGCGPLERRDTVRVVAGLETPKLELGRTLLIWSKLLVLHVIPPARLRLIDRWLLTKSK